MDDRDMGRLVTRMGRRGGVPGLRGRISGREGGGLPPRRDTREDENVWLGMSLFICSKCVKINLCMPNILVYRRRAGFICFFFFEFATPSSPSHPRVGTMARSYQNNISGVLSKEWESTLEKLFFFPAGTHIKVRRHICLSRDQVSHHLARVRHADRPV